MAFRKLSTRARFCKLTKPLESKLLSMARLYTRFYHKGDLSEQENGSSDLVITQYFLKKEGTYLQHLNNRSNNKIWRQKLYFRLENMQIIDQRDN